MVGNVVDADTTDTLSVAGEDVLYLVDPIHTALVLDVVPGLLKVTLNSCEPVGTVQEYEPVQAKRCNGEHTPSRVRLFSA